MSVGASIMEPGVIRRRGGVALAAGLVLLMSACASLGGGDAPRQSVRPPVVNDPAPIVSGTLRPYQIRGQWYYPAHQPDYDEVGLASWYGQQFHGRPTATGEIFDMSGLSAAHKTLPLPGLVEVTNLENGRVVILRMNDRGPFVDGRIIDLSRGAAQELGLLSQGVGRVRVRYVGPAPRGGGGGAVLAASGASTPAPLQAPTVRATASSGVYWVQAGSFSERGNAREAARRLGDRARVDRVRVDGRRYYRVMVGPWSDAALAEQARQGARAHGFGDARIVGG